MAADKAQQETASNKSGKWKGVVETVCAVIGGLFLCCKHLLSLWVMAGTSFSPEIVNTEVDPEWKDVIRYGRTDNVAYYFDYSPIPTDKECFAIDLCVRGFKHKKHNAYEVGCYMVFPHYPDSIVKGNRLVVYLHNGDSAVAKSYLEVRHPSHIRRTSRHQPRSLKAERFCSYSLSKKNLSKLLQNMPDSIKVESANGQIVRPASKKANIRLQQRYYLLEEYLNEFQYTMKERNQ